MRRASGFLAACIGAALACLALPAVAQSGAGRPVAIVAPATAGSGTDLVARILAEELRAGTGGSYVVHNRPGASGILGSESVARAAPDGHTLLISSSASHSAAPSLFRKIPFDPIRDFTPVASLAQVPFLLVVAPSITAKSAKELAEQGRANPGKLTYAYGSTTSQIAAATFAGMAGFAALPVPYKSQPPALNDLLAGQVSFMFIDVAVGAPFVKSGRLRALAVTSGRRTSHFPELPTLAEAGFPGADMVAWMGVSAPAGTPADVVARLNAGIAKALANPAVQARLAGLGYETWTTTPQEFSEFVTAQLAVWAQLIRRAGIEAE